MGGTNHRPIPREEPEGDEPQPDGSPTVRPPPVPASAADGSDGSAATYEKLRDSCRAQTIADGAQLDDELAVEAEVLRVALDRKSTRTKISG